jgi:predicted Fe-S protein YdhL (DUF1289 family)
MGLDTRRTPCVGICSTTYGDLVCRGCKRFAHEIASWNAYSPDQQSRVWRRLVELRDAATAEHVDVCDPRRLSLAVAPLRLPPDSTALTQAYLLLRRKSRTLAMLGEVGLRAVHADGVDATTLRDRIDAEFLRRSIAVYERSFRVVVDE